jgi:hypothetical protein
VLRASIENDNVGRGKPGNRENPGNSGILEIG